MHRYISKEDIQMVYLYVERYSTSLIIMEMQIKTTMKLPASTVGKSTIKNKIIKYKIMQKINKGMDKRESLCTAGRNIKWCSHYRK